MLAPFHRDGDGQLREPGDASPLQTAAREACEELGLVPAQIEVLEALPAARTATSGYLVWPFVARLHGVSPNYGWRPQPSEEAAVLDVPVAELARPDVAGTGEMSFPTWPGPRTVPVCYVEGQLLWGLTLRILDPVLPRALAGDWPI